MCESITPTFPDDAMIYISFDGGKTIELQADDRVDLVRLQLDEQATIKLVAALMAALAKMRNEVKP